MFFTGENRKVWIFLYLNTYIFLIVILPITHSRLPSNPSHELCAFFLSPEDRHPPNSIFLIYVTLSGLVLL